MIRGRGGEKGCRDEGGEYTGGWEGEEGMREGGDTKDEGEGRRGVGDGTGGKGMEGEGRRGVGNEMGGKGVEGERRGNPSSYGICEGQSFSSQRREHICLSVCQIYFSLSPEKIPRQEKDYRITERRNDESKKKSEE